MSTENLIGLIVAVLLLGYLVAALIFPEAKPRGSNATDRKRF